MKDCINGALAGFLVGVECVSGKLSVVACRGRTISSFERAITEMIEMNYGEIHTIVSDRESAFTSLKFRRGIRKKYGISWTFLPNRNKVGRKKGLAGLGRQLLLLFPQAYRPERMIRFLKERLSMALRSGAVPKNRWWTLLDGIVSDYNRKFIPGTRLRRSAVNKNNFEECLSQLYKSKDPTMLFHVSTGKSFSPRNRKRLFALEVGARVLVRADANYKLARSSMDKRSVEGAYGRRSYRVTEQVLRSCSNYYLTPCYRLAGLKGLFYQQELIEVPFADDDDDADPPSDIHPASGR